MYEGQFVLFFNKVCKVVMLSYDVQVCVCVYRCLFFFFSSGAYNRHQMTGSACSSFTLLCCHLCTSCNPVRRD